MPIYDRPTWQLLSEYIKSQSQPVIRKEIIAWFSQQYPKIKSSTVAAHLVACSVNDPTRVYYATVSHNILYRLPNGTYEAYDPDKHGLFSPQGQAADRDQNGKDVDEIPDDTAAEDNKGEFQLEVHLEEFIYNNWDHIDFGRQLKLFAANDGRTGRQWATEIGRFDFLCTDESDGSFVVVELKKGKPTDKVLGQLQRYMGWVTQHLANGGAVKGMIITPPVPDPHLQYALKVAPSIEWKCYEVKFTLNEPPAE